VTSSRRNGRGYRGRILALTMGTVCELVVGLAKPDFVKLED
jgi:hypothetical protein